MKKFYKCRHCGNLIIKINSSEVPLICCGEEMEGLVPNSSDAKGEKHIPVVIKKDDNKLIDVKVGEDMHPMTEEHFIEWIYIETKSGNQLKYLKPSMKPVGTFIITKDDELLNVYAYCNLHGLWVLNVNK